MKIGTKSLLFGAHQFLIHPVFVFIAWWKLFEFPKDFRLWIAFVIHDWGYWQKPNMDGPEGDEHVWGGARLMGRFDYSYWYGHGATEPYWFNLSAFHSRTIAKRFKVKPSRLCYADKMACVLEPAWLYLPRVILTGEIKEYMSITYIKYKEEPLTNESRRAWFKSVQQFLKGWVKGELNAG